MADYATLDDLAAYWEPIGEDRRPRAKFLLGIASELVSERCAGEPNATMAKWVVCDLVRTAMLHDGASGVTQATASAGGYSSTMTYANPAGDLYWKTQYDTALNIRGVSFGSIAPARGTE